MQNRSMQVLTNIPGLEQAAWPEAQLCFSQAGSDGLSRFILKCLRSDLVILEQDGRRVMVACLIKLFIPWSRFRIISVDLILRPPKSFLGSTRNFFKKLLFRKIHRFILYFKDLRGYERFYGIGPERTTYVPFKVNNWESLQRRHAPLSEGDYVLCAGRTLRDTTTFVEAMRQAGVPGLLLQQSRELLSEHGTEPWNGELPDNVRLLIDEGNQSEKLFMECIAGARIVVIPRFKGDIASTGIGTYLLAMALNRCVIISEGPGASDVLTDQAVIVPAEDPLALSKQIDSLWQDATRRAALIARGREYANDVAGEKRLSRDILRASLRSLGNVDLGNPDQTKAKLMSTTPLRSNSQR